MMNTNTTTVNITEFGAVAGEPAVQTAAIQRAVDHVHSAGGGTVVVPEGVFATGGIVLRSNITLRLMRGAVLAGSRNLLDYMPYDLPKPPEATRRYDPWCRWNNAVIKAVDAENIAILGEAGSLIDGSNSIDPIGEQGHRGAHGINLHRCRNIMLEGYRIANAGNFSHAVFFCENLAMRKVHVQNGKDGLNVRGTSNIHVSGCLFETIDDCVAGYGNQNVVIRDSRFTTFSHGIRFSASNMLVEDCHFYGLDFLPFPGPETMAEREAGIVREAGTVPCDRMQAMFLNMYNKHLPLPGKAEHVVFRHCRVENVKRAVKYHVSESNDWQSGNPLRDLHFEHVEFSGIEVPLTVIGTADGPLTLTMENVSFRFREGFQHQPFLRAGHCKLIRLKNVSLPTATQGPLIQTWTPAEIELENVTAAVPDDQRVAMTDEPVRA